MSTGKNKCPHCGNDNPSYIDDNGERASSPDYTLLCCALVNPDECAFDDAEYCADMDADGLVRCGMQWCPNQN